MDDKILTRVSRRVTLDESRNSEFKAFDDMVNMEYELPSGLAGREDVVKFVDPAPHDAEKVACNIFDTYNPKWDVLPRGPDDKDSAEELERWLEWMMQRANEHGETEPFRKMMAHSLRYGMVAAQLDYLPYWQNGTKDKAQKEWAGGGPFCIVLHHPSSVHYEMGSYGLRWVASVTNCPAADVIDHWEAYTDKKVKGALKKIDAFLEDDEEARLTVVDYTDHNKRYVSCWITEGEEPDLDNDAEEIVLVDEENKLPFINWVVAVGSGDPLLTTLHRGNLWTNANLTETIKRSTAFRRAFYPLLMEEGQGEEVQTDYTGATDKLIVPPGKKVTQLIPPPIDQAFNQLSAEDQGRMSQSTSMQSLLSLGNNNNNVQFATINAIIQINMTQLESYKRTMEKALKGLGKMAFKWIKFVGKSETAYRPAPGGNGLMQGQQISIGPEDFDEETLFIEAKLIPNAPTDKMQLVNMAVQLKQAGFRIPDSEAIERLGYGNPEALAERWAQEQMEQTALQQFIKERDAELQVQTQAAIMQLQLQSQGQPPQEQPPQQQGQAPVMPGGQGMNPAMGGSSPMEAAPDMTRTAIEGQDITGRGV